MVINGKEIKRYQNFKKLDSYYYQTVKTVAREALNELRFIEIKTHYVSKSSDSIYFTFHMNHHEESFVLSLRNHLPKEYQENYFYIYLHQYSSIAEIKRNIQKQVIIHYNKMAEQIGIRKIDSDHPNKRHNHNSTLKKKRKNRTKMCSTHAQQSFDMLVKQINKGNQKTN